MGNNTNFRQRTWNNPKLPTSISIQPPTTAASKITNTSSPFIKILTQAKMAERRAKGLCYNCDELYSMRYQCKKLFWLDINETSEEFEEPTEVPGMSLRAIMGHYNSCTMQWVAKIRGCPLKVLIDSDSIHNFLSQMAAQGLYATINHNYSLHVAVANGQKIPSFGTCKEDIRVAGSFFSIELFVMLLDECDVVLGIQRFKTSGPILWNFATLTMSLEMRQQQITLHGLQYDPGPLIYSRCQDKKQQQLEDLLNEFAALFQEPAGLPPMKVWSPHYFISWFSNSGATL